MNIFGIGPAELVIVFLVMLVVAGPKRMIRWAYIAGQYTAKLRVMWQEATVMLKKELERAGVEPEVVDTVQQLVKTGALRKTNPLNALVSEIKKPVEDALKPVEQVIEEVSVSSPQPKTEKSSALPISSRASEAAPAEKTDHTEAAASEDDAEKVDPDQPPSEGNTPGSYHAWTSN